MVLRAKKGSLDNKGTKDSRDPLAHMAHVGFKGQLDLKAIRVLLDLKGQLDLKV